MKEKYYEELLNIKTTGDQSWDETKKCYHPYEPTPYFALDKLFESYYINEKDSVIDFGCGKGRLNFYLNYNYNCNVLGIEMDENFYNQCMENKKEYLKNNKREEEKINFLWINSIKSIEKTSLEDNLNYASKLLKNLNKGNINNLISESYDKDTIVVDEQQIDKGYIRVIRTQYD